MTTALHQIVLTVAYTQVFDFPLTNREVVERLILGSDFAGTAASSKKSHPTHKKNNLITENGYWGIGSPEAVQKQVRQRANRTAISAQKLAEFEPVVRLCRWLPWVVGLAVTGSVSMNNAEEKDDVDVMIVCRTGRLWLTRPILVLFSFLQGKRRSWNHEEENSWCFNLWLEEQSLAVPPSSRSVYTAYEVCQARWLVSKNKIDQIFLLQNSWVSSVLPFFYSACYAKALRQKTILFDRWSIVSDLLDSCNRLAYQLQRWYMHRHMTRERVSYAAAFFHPRDTKQQIVTRWKSIITNH